MNELKVFENSEFGKVRTIDIESNIWFVGKDVAEILGYINASKAVSTHVDNDDKQFLMVDIADSQNGNVPVGQSKTAFINESGLYSLILSSKLPAAKKFKRWVTNEVLPSIRKHGLYATDELLANPDIAIAAFTALKEERERNKALKTQVAVKDQVIQELQPKATYYDLVLNCKDLLSTTKIAKDYGKSAVWLNNLLHELGIQFKRSDIWLLYQKYADKGYTSTKTHTYNKDDGTYGAKVHTYWTQKGRLFIYSLLKDNGYLPLIELDDLSA